MVALNLLSLRRLPDGRHAADGVHPHCVLGADRALLHAPREEVATRHRHAGQVRPGERQSERTTASGHRLLTVVVAFFPIRLCQRLLLAPGPHRLIPDMGRHSSPIE